MSENRTCPLGRVGFEEGEACPGSDANGCCTVFTDEAIAARVLGGSCNHKNIRMPLVGIYRPKGFFKRNPLKAAKAAERNRH